MLNVSFKSNDFKVIPADDHHNYVRAIQIIRKSPEEKTDIFTKFDTAIAKESGNIKEDLMGIKEQLIKMFGR